VPGVFCAIPQFETGGERVITVTGTLAPDSGGTAVTNVAGISTDALQRLDELADNSDVATFVPGSVDLTLAKTRLQAGTLPVGGETTFRLVVANQGTAPANGVAVSDPLPAGLTLVSAPPACTSGGQTVTCDVGTLAAGAQQSFDLLVRAEVSAAEQTLTNLATVSTTDPDVAPANNGASANVTVGPFSMLSASKTASASSVPAGSSVTYTVTVLNNGPSVAGDVDVTEFLPSGLTLRSITPSQGTCAGTICNLGDLLAGASAQIVIVVDTEASAAGKRLVNSVEVTAATPSSPARAEAPVEVTVPRQPAALPVDVAVNVSGPSGFVREGRLVTFRIDVTNRGSGAATSVVLTGTASPAVGGRVTGLRLLQASCGRLPLRCELGTLASGQRRSYRVRLRPRGLRRHTLTASVTAAEVETSRANNLDRASVRIRAAQTTVRVTKRASASSARSGTVVGFTITVRNVGPVPARNFTVCDRLPRGLAFERLGGATLTNGRACWTIARLARNGTVRYHVMTRALRVTRARRVTNTAIVRGGNTARRVASAAVTLRPFAPVRPPFTG
jgi:uncharacterized repeat protein (TIGR01451 family)